MRSVRSTAIVVRKNASNDVIIPEFRNWLILRQERRAPTIASETTKLAFPDETNESLIAADEKVDPVRRMTGSGQNAKYLSRVDVFRLASKTRTLLGAVGTSHLCHEETHAPQQTRGLASIRHW
jgi:hypothetical protein